MPENKPSPNVVAGFEAQTVRVALTDIEPTRPVADSIRRSRKFAQIATSIRTIGVVEPLVVTSRRCADPGRYLLLDGHLRFEALKELGQAYALCLIATDDETFTYNYRISRLSTIREHRMMLNAVKEGVSMDRLAAALHVDLGAIRRKTRLLDGICSEAAALLEDKHVSVDAFRVLRRMVPVRQIEVAEMMVAMNKFSIGYARTMLVATPDAQLLPGRKRPKVGGLTQVRVALMQRESSSLDRQFKLVERSYGADQLDLVLAQRYIASLVGNHRIARFLKQQHIEIFGEFVQLADRKEAAA